MLAFFSSHRRLIIRLTIGIAAFVFFGFFAPILLSTKPIVINLLPVAPTKLPTLAPRVTLRGEEVVWATLSFLANFKKNGNYSLAFTCLKKGEFARCDPFPYRISNPAFLSVLYDRLGKNGEGDYKSVADQIVAQTLSLCGNDPQRCDDGFFALLSRYREQPQENLLRALIRVGERQFDVTPPQLPQIILQIHKLLGIYQATGEVVYLTLAQTRYQQLTERTNFSDDDPVVATFKRVAVRRWDCGRNLLAVTLFQATADSALLNQAKAFFADTKKVTASDHLGSINLCLEGLSLIEQLTGEGRFRDNRKTLIEATLRDFWDSAFAPKFTGDYGFLLLKTGQEYANEVINYKYITETAWFLTFLVPLSKTVLTF